MLKLLIGYNFIFYCSRNMYVFQHWLVYLFFFTNMITEAIFDGLHFIWLLAKLNIILCVWGSVLFFKPIVSL